VHQHAVHVGQPGVHGPRLGHAPIIPDGGASTRTALTADPRRARVSTGGIPGRPGIPALWSGCNGY
jgi:hypothetical protein